MKQLTMFGMVTWLDTSTVMGICMFSDYNMQKVSIHYIATSALRETTVYRYNENVFNKSSN